MHACTCMNMHTNRLPHTLTIQSHKVQAQPCSWEFSSGILVTSTQIALIWSHLDMASVWLPGRYIICMWQQLWIISTWFKVCMWCLCMAAVMYWYHDYTPAIPSTVNYDSSMHAVGACRLPKNQSVEYATPAWLNISASSVLSYHKDNSYIIIAI